MAQMRIQNARSGEQERRMLKLQELGLCYFCRQGSEDDLTLPTLIHESMFWYITKNNFPVEGSVYHYLIVSKRHVTRETELTREEWMDLLPVIAWLEKMTGVTGYSKFSRNGDLDMTCATLDHLHIHFLAGTRDEGDFDKIKVSLGYKKPRS